MVDNPIASRVLHCQMEGKGVEVIVRLGAPMDDDALSTCEYEISIAGRREAYQIVGRDSIHALQLAMFMVGSALQSLRGASNWSWNDEPYIGFPSSLHEPIVGLRP